MTNNSSSAPPPSTHRKVALAGHNIAKRFGHVNALIDANVTVHAGEVVALFGDNGAGKSTFLKTLLGVHQPDEGKIIVDDQEVEMNSIRDAQNLGIDCVHQELALAPDISVVDNMFLGHEEMRHGGLGLLGALSRKDMTEKADAALRELSINLPSLKIAVRDLSGGQRQAVAVARAVMWSRSALLLDEPTAALGARQSEIVGDMMRTVASRGLGVLCVSHDLPRALKFADRVVILWRGETALDAPAAGLTVPDVVSTMVGYKKEEAA
ncbi:ATP-binding cassette domain-containing protein [Arthrobacter sp. KNU-44]|uniref:ATP-binding cassette domain-containing protein n=1 Tax=Arthrobacter sp. KNU-44 TaxID=3450744 RepID=UPI003F428938